MIKNKALFLSLLIVLCVAIGSVSAVDVNDIDTNGLDNELNMVNAVDIQVEDTTVDIEDDENGSTVVLNDSNTKNVETISSTSASSVIEDTTISSVSANTVSTATTAQILTSAVNLKNYIEKYHGLSGTVNLNGGSVDTEEFLYLMTMVIKDINAGKTSKTYSVRNIPDPNRDLNGDWVLSLKLTKAQYVDVATRVYNYIINNGAVPNYATLINSQKANYKLYTYAFASILSSYKTNKALPSSYTFDSKVFETYSISKNLSSRASNKLTFYLTTDNIINPSTDLAMLNQLKDALVKLGYNAKVLGVGPNWHNIADDYGCTGTNSVLLCCFGAVDCCPIEEWVGKDPKLGDWFPKQYKGANILSVWYLDPYGCAANINTYVGIAHDAKDGYYGTPLSNPAQFMKDNGISYIQTGTADAVIKILKSVFPGPGKTITTTTNTTTTTTTKYVTVSQIISASVSVRNYITKNHALPSTVKVGSYSITKAQFAPLMGYAIKAIYAGKSLSTKISVLSVKDTNYTNSINHTASKASYVDLAYRVFNYCKNNKVVPNYGSIDGKNVDSRSFIYAFSRILTYYNTNNKLISKCPFESSVFIKPKTTSTTTTTSTTKKVTVSQIISASVNVKSYVLKYHKLPSTVKVGSYTVTKDQFAYLVAIGVQYVSANKLSTQVTIINVKASSYTSSISYTVSKTYYVDAANRVAKYCSNNKVTPNYVTISSKKVDIRSYIYGFSKILAYYKTNGKLPTTCLFESKVFK